MAINNIGDSQQFNYTGGVQTLTITKKGLYKLEVWGGNGGTGTNSGVSRGGYGGKSSGYKVFNPGEVLYICCGGGNRNTYNGGGQATNNSVAWAAAGGGATHIASVTGTLAAIGASNLDKIYIIAGGGGGGGEQSNRIGGSGGGTEGGKGNPTSVYTVYGGTQTNGGYNSYYGNNQSHYTHGQFGQGGNAETKSPMPSGAYYGGGGGGGLYGGGGGVYSTNANNNTSGSGGSGYIGGVPEITFKGTTYSPATANGVNNGNGYAVITLVDAITDNCRFKVNGEWKNAMLYKKINGEWVTGMLRTKVSGSWKNGG